MVEKVVTDLRNPKKGDEKKKKGSPRRSAKNFSVALKPLSLKPLNLKKFTTKRINPPTISSLLPNMITVLALCIGLSSVRFALLGRWELAVSAILIAAILDNMDGRVARFFGSSTRFGAELDSLSDFVSFGVSPALVIYLYTLHQWKGFGWAIGLFFTVCSALRLARFNTRSIEGTVPAWSQGFFTGIPAPGGASLAIFPLILHFVFESTPLASVINHPGFSGGMMFIIAILMISRMPTYSFKKMHIDHKYVLPILLGVAVLVAALFSEPWITLSLLGLAYICTFPFSIKAYKKLEQSLAKTEKERGTV